MEKEGRYFHGKVGFRTSVVDGKIYAIGGLSKDFDFLSTVEVYDPKTDKWTRKADMPTPRRIDNSVSAVNGKIYAIGGASNNSDLSAVEEYDPAKDVWVKKSPMPTSRYGLCTVVANNKIYAIGGTTAALNFNESLPTVEEYDPSTDKWTKKTNMPTPRLCLSAVQINGKIYVMGGYSGFNKAIVHKTVEVYDPAADRWSAKSDMVMGRFAFGASTSDGKIYVFGGVMGERNAGVEDSSVEEYNPINDMWAQKADMPIRKAGLSASTVDGKIYTVGGGPVSGTTIIATSTVEEYTPYILSPTGVESKEKLSTTWADIKYRQFHISE
ncbi:hypothetical protein FJZ33_10065 [Candidatus Poribacteria bacterium]|nr:hypothetical protein [Candidatus Poribacteria bacterium]